MPTLESRDYVATASDVEAITKSRISASIQADKTQDTYLKCLAATTIAELGETPRTRGAAKSAAGLTQDDIRLQLTALETVHMRFYQVVIKTILENADLGRNRKSLAQKKATFARTSKSLLRSWIKCGHDITTRPINQFTKPLLQKELPDAERSANSAARVKRRALGLADRLIGMAGELARTDAPSATAALEAAMGLLGQKLAELGSSAATTKPEVAMREGRPFRRGSTVFWPVTPAENGTAATQH